MGVGPKLAPRRGLKNCLCGWQGGRAKVTLLLFHGPHSHSGSLSRGQTDMSFAKGPQHRS